jgi:phosphomannomutase
MAPSIVDWVAGTEIDSQLLDTIADRFAVAEVAQTDSIQAGTDDTHSTSVLQRVQPVRKGSRFALTKKEKLHLPSHQVTVAYKLHFVKRVKFDVVARVAEHFRSRCKTIDGVRVIFPHGWGLVRTSDTQPVLVMRFEADSVETSRPASKRNGGGDQEGRRW